MNFFEHQDRARRQSRSLILAFCAAAMATILAVDTVLLIAFGTSPAGDSILATLGNNARPILPLTLGGLVSSNQTLLLCGSALVSAIIIASSAFRIASLKSGGGKVAQELGGVLVNADASDPSLRRLSNIVEEIALASGVPVPEIYVLEKEAGINAFAAGFSPSDASVTVTRGALDHLSRAELQGVVAHEFSHIFNGDMRINLRLMGYMFGILMLSLIGRRIMVSAGSRGRNGRDGSAVVLLGVAIVATGYAGMFFARWIKSAISRQREFLADASAVQYTRDTTGISGVLKKLAVLNDSSRLDADVEEISHMLFGEERNAFLFATHPPVIQRIQRLEPHFNVAELDVIRKAMLTDIHDAVEDEADPEPARAGGPLDWIFLDPDKIMQSIGNPGAELILAAAELSDKLPAILRSAASSVEWAPAVVLYTLLDRNDDIRERQLLIVAERFEHGGTDKLRELLSRSPLISVEQRRPLFELAFPALKRRPTRDLQSFSELVRQLVHEDDRVDTFEYLLSRSISLHIADLLSPAKSRSAGGLSLKKCQTEIRILLSVLVLHGHEAEGSTQEAYTRALTVLGFSGGKVAELGQAWPPLLDNCLNKVDGLHPAAKNQLVVAMLTAIAADGKAVLSELELVRAMCAVLHVPLPIQDNR
jgi:Zn-dependent protease with chaperone function